MKYNLNLSNEDKAWLAAVIDCEGSIMIEKPKNNSTDYYHTTIKVECKDRSLIREIKRRATLGAINFYFKNTHLTKEPILVHRWQAQYKQALAILKEIQPYLVTKKGQAILAIRLEEQKNKYRGNFQKGKFHFPGLPKAELKFRHSLYQMVDRLNKHHSPI